MFSLCSFKFKTNGIITLLHRAYRISSNFVALHLELEFLKSFFHNNGFLLPIVEMHIKKFLNNNRQVKLLIPTVDKQKIYFSLPYFGTQSDNLKRELELILYKYFQHLDFKIVLFNSSKIGSFFIFKDQLPKFLRSNDVYKFSCGRCPSQYIGSTCRTLGVRACEHIGKSHRTGIPLNRSPHSAVRSHCDRCSGDLSLDHFDALCTSSGLDLRILECLFSN